VFVWTGINVRKGRGMVLDPNIELLGCPMFCRLLSFFALTLAKGSNPDKNTICKIFLKNFNVYRLLNPPKYLGGSNGPKKYEKMQNV